MKHRHVGNPKMACSLCFVEAQQVLRAQEELRGRRFWAWMIVSFSFVLALVAAFVLYRIGMGR